MEEKQSNREYKSDVFAELFSTKDKQIELFNAVMGTDFTNEMDWVPVTLKEVLFMVLKNDLAFIIGNRFIMLTEHQSTINKNMPMRMFLYLAREYEKIVLNSTIYKENLVKVPTPELVVLYNGKQKYKKESILKLSDAFLEREWDFALELKVRVININYCENHEILNACQTLKEYSIFIEKIRNYEDAGISRGEAITTGIKECIDENVLKEFLISNGSEVYNMLFTQFNMEDALLVRGEEGLLKGKIEGKIEGKAEDIIEFLKDYGVVPEDLKDKIYGEEDLNILTKWLKLSVKVDSIEEFIEEINRNN